MRVPAVGRNRTGLVVCSSGLALCKIHHASFDTHILGVSPNYRVAIRRDVLEEIDGPMPQCGLPG